MLKLVVGCLLAVILAVAGDFLVYAHTSYPTTSAGNVLADLIDAHQHPHVALRQEAIAFLPYWRLDTIQHARYDLLSEVNFFSLTIGPDGHIVHIIGQQTEPGWRWWNTQQVKDLIPRMQIDGDRVDLTLAMLDNATIGAFLRSPSAQQNLIADTLQQIDARHLNGITLDIEYSGVPPPAYRRAFTAFAQRFSAALRRQTSSVTLSLTLPPLAGRVPGLFDLRRLAPLFDRFIGMTYDYYNANTAFAGPGAPMHGYSSHRFIFDVTTAYRDYMRALPRSHIIMGIPYGGWDWAVRKGKGLLRPVLPANNPNSYAAILSYGRMRAFSTLNRARCGWNAAAEEPHCLYADIKGVLHDVWFENNRSIRVKEAYARSHGLAGIAIWVLGYDSSYPDLWTILRRTFGS